MKFKIKKSENLLMYYYDVGFRKEFKITYKLPTIKEVKTWWNKLFKRYKQ